LVIAVNEEEGDVVVVFRLDHPHDLFFGQSYQDEVVPL